jgi:hypothetical protein
LRTRITLLGLALAAVAAVTGCGGPEGGPLFDDEGGQEVSCMAHQTDPPGERYTDVAMRNTGEILTVMRYYTAHGAKPFCDGAAASEADRAWAEYYVSLRGAPEKVSTILG